MVGKAMALSMGVGIAAGAVAVMMLPRNNPVRKLAYKAASTVEDAATKASDKLAGSMNM